MATWTADDGTLIYYETQGTGPGKPDLLLLPGLLGAVSRQWRPFRDPLAETYRLIVPDLRGHGRSENQDAVIRPERMMQDLAGLLDHLQIERVHISGYSLGGYLGLMLYLHQPRQVASLLMHATKFYWNAEAVEVMRGQLDPDVMAEKVPTYATQLVKDHGRRWRSLVRQAGDLVALLSATGVTENMAARVQIPVIVSVGDQDELISLPEAARLSRVFPQGGLLVLPHTRHPFRSVSPYPLLPVMQTLHR